MHWTFIVFLILAFASIVAGTIVSLSVRARILLTKWKILQETPPRQIILHWWRPENWKEGHEFYQWGFLHRWRSERLGPRLYQYLDSALEVASRAVLHPEHKNHSYSAVVWKCEYRNGELVPTERVAALHKGSRVKGVEAETLIQKLGVRINNPATVSVREACLAHGYDPQTKSVVF